MPINLTLTETQAAFVQDFDTKYTAFVSGFRGGKTYALMCKSVIAAAKNIDSTGAICLPTNGMLSRGFRPEWETFLDDHYIPFTTIPSVNGYQLHFGSASSRVLLLSSENYMRARNLELSWFALDETDAMVGRRAWDAWNLMISRLSGGNKRVGFAVSTPEGFNFMYDAFHQQLEDNPHLNEYYKLYRGTTYDNPYLPDDYIPALEAKYPPQLLQAYLQGKFVNLKSGTVYVNYDKDANHTELTPETIPSTAPLHIGIDFNYNSMSAVVAYCDKQVHIIDEIIGSKNTIQLIQAINERYRNRTIIVYPDASSNANKTSASSTDLAQLNNAGFKIKALTKNPRIKDRVNSVNAMLLNGNGYRALLVNNKKCRVVSRCLQQQVYGDDGMPIKDGIVDGPNDALGYFIYYNWPVEGRPTIRTI